MTAIDYESNPAPITFFYSDPVDSVGRYQPVLTANGDLMIVGGIRTQHNNFEPAATVYLLHVATSALAPAESRSLWLWLALATLIIAVIVVTSILLRRHKKTVSTDAVVLPAESNSTASDNALMERICHYMEEQQPYLDSDFKMQDMADAMNSNRTYVSNCIKNTRDCSFSQFVNSYRVEHAKMLLKRNSGMKLSEIWTASGFSSESSFFRAFKAHTGMTPMDWISDN